MKILETILSRFKKDDNSVSMSDPIVITKKVNRNSWTIDEDNTIFSLQNLGMSVKDITLLLHKLHIYRTQSAVYQRLRKLNMDMKNKQ